MTREALLLRHSDPDGPGAIARELHARGVGLREVRGYDGDAIPESMGEASALVVMGGPVSVRDEADYPFITAEKRLVAAALAAGVPVLAVCFGAQLLASVAGGRVFLAKAPEIGWHPVDREGDDPIFAGLPKQFLPFHWHGDAIALPPGATRLARSAATEVQAFRVGQAYGLQFHIEGDLSMIDTMVQAFESELHDAKVDVRALAEQTRTHIVEQERLASLLFGAWAARVAAG